MKTIIMLFLFLNISVYGTSLAQINSDWVNSHYKYIEEILEHNDTDKLIPVMNTLGVLWIFKDGAIGNEISPLLSKFAYQSPELFFYWFKKHKKQYYKWIENLPYGTYTDVEERSKKLEILKSDSLKYLSKYYQETKDKEIQQMVSDLINKLKDVKVRVID